MAARPTALIYKQTKLVINAMTSLLLYYLEEVDFDLSITNFMIRPSSGEIVLSDPVHGLYDVLADLHHYLEGELSAREVSQILREIDFGRSVMSKVGQESWDEIYAGHFMFTVEGWQISIYNDCGQLNYCEQCVSPDGRRWSFDPGDRFGKDPVALLSTWEHQEHDRILKAL